MRNPLRARQRLSTVSNRQLPCEPMGRIEPRSAWTGSEPDVGRPVATPHRGGGHSMSRWNRLIAVVSRPLHPCSKGPNVPENRRASSPIPSAAIDKSDRIRKQGAHPAAACQRTCGTSGVRSSDAHSCEYGRLLRNHLPLPTVVMACVRLIRHVALHCRPGFAGPTTSSAQAATGTAPVRARTRRRVRA